MTAASATEWCKMRADSISAVERRWPDTLMTSNSQDISTISHINTMSTIHALLTINTATDPNITILGAGCTISREIETLVGTEIGVEITVVVVVDSTSHGWPWLSNGKNASNII